MLGGIIRHSLVIQQCVSKLVVGNLVRLATVACHDLSWPSNCSYKRGVVSSFFRARENPLATVREIVVFKGFRF